MAATLRRVAVESRHELPALAEESLTEGTNSYGADQDSGGRVSWWHALRHQRWLRPCAHGGCQRGGWRAERRIQPDGAAAGSATWLYRHGCGLHPPEEAAAGDGLRDERAWRARRDTSSGLRGDYGRAYLYWSRHRAGGSRSRAGTGQYALLQRQRDAGEDGGDRPHDAHRRGRGRGQSGGRRTSRRLSMRLHAQGMRPQPLLVRRAGLRYTWRVAGHARRTGQWTPH